MIVSHNFNKESYKMPSEFRAQAKRIENIILRQEILIHTNNENRNKRANIY
jgi:hypothetical protein